MKTSDVAKPIATKVSAPLEAETPAAASLWGLYFALYHSSPDVLLGLPRSVQDAYVQVQRIARPPASTGS